jgi:hypothetical protein
MEDGPSDAPMEAPSALDRETAGWARCRERLAMTRELAEIGMTLARRLVEGETSVADAGLAYSRIARAVRMTLALEAVIGGEVELRAGRVRDARYSQHRMDDMDRAEAVRVKEQGLVRKAVDWAIDKDMPEPGDAREAAALRRELNEVLEDALDWEQFTGLPLIEVVERICADLGVPFDTELWMDKVDAETVEAAVADRTDAPDWALEVAGGDDGAWPAGSGKPRPPD